MKNQVKRMQILTGSIKETGELCILDKKQTKGTGE
jgi:hypothetical protein